MGRIVGVELRSAGEESTEKLEGEEDCNAVVTEDRSHERVWNRVARRQWESGVSRLEMAVEWES